MSYYLVLQATYHAIELALMHDSTFLALKIVDKHASSKQLMPTIDGMLREHQQTYSTLTGIIVNQGPAPFTTLRVLLATVNGISFATRTPLIGVNGLQALLDTASAHDTVTVALLNAFNKEVYFAIQNAKTREFGCSTLMEFLSMLNNEYAHMPLQCVGNGALLYAQEIQQSLGTRAHIVPGIETSSLEQIAALGLLNHGQQDQLLPLYLKKPH